MKKLLAIFVLCAATLCVGQNAAYQNIAIGNLNTTSNVLQKIPNAIVTVFNCTGSPGNCGSLTAASLCLSITDLVCNQSNVVTADSNGNFAFYIKAGRYAYTVSAPGFNTVTYVDVIINAATTDPGGGITGGANPQLGDILRNNVNGDGFWDAVSYASPMAVVIPTMGGQPIAYGAWTNGAVTGLGTSTSNFPTQTAGVTNTYSAVATASLNSTVGLAYANNGSNSKGGVMAFYRWSLKVSVANTGQVRYWMGMGCWGGGGATGGNSVQLGVANTVMASDNPNKSLVGFRYSQGTDSHWVAVAAQAGGSQTVVDTGVIVDGAPHLFEMTTNATLTAVTYFIDGVQVAQISNGSIPSAYGTVNFEGEPFFQGDNKNQNVVTSMTLFYEAVALR